MWDLDLSPIAGHEQGGFRPALVLSVNLFDEGPAEVVVVIPITRTNRKISWHVAVQPPEGGLTNESFIQSENVLLVSKQRLENRHGRESAATMEQIEDRVRILLGL